jgi:hypothetical protein
MSFYELSTEERLQVGIKDSLVRYSVGVEDADDLIADLSQAILSDIASRGSVPLSMVTAHGAFWTRVQEFVPLFPFQRNKFAIEYP